MLFNNIDLSSYFKIKEINGIGLVSKEISQINLAGMDGTYPSQQKRPARNITVSISIRAKNREELRGKIENLNQILSVEEPVPIIFPYQPDRTYYGMPELINEGVEYPHKHDTEIHIICFDPYKYGPEVNVPFNGDSIVINNVGTGRANPVIELVAKEHVAFAMVQNQNDEYMSIGEPLEVGEELVSTKRLLMEERGETLNTWNSTPTEVDGGENRGVMSTDSDGITVPNYGTGDEWHGPALIKDIPTAQDFEVEMNLEGRLTGGDQTFRVEFYLYDEGMNNLGKMAVLDNRLGQNDIRAEGRYGEFLGGHINYPISGENYHYKWKDFYGLLRMRRVGNEFEFYVTRVATDTRHVYSLKETYVDNNNELQGRLKYVQIHIGKYGDTPRAMSAKINYIRAYEILEQLNFDKPVMAYPDDKILFDFDNEEILINGEDRKDLKDFGGSFFSLAKGENQLIVHPENSFETNITYKPRYL